MADNRAKDPNWKDGDKLRLSDFFEAYSRLFLVAGLTNFSTNKVMSKMEGKPMEFYPSELSVDTLQETKDGWFPLGIRSKDNIFAGYVDSYGSGTFGTRTDTATVVEEECKEETKYNCKVNPFDTNDARAMALMWGQSHNTAIGIYLPLKVYQWELGIGNFEHKEIMLFPNSEKNINQLLNTGKLLDSAVFDHTLGLIKQYQRNRRDGKIKPNVVHEGLLSTIQRVV